ncbi:MAG: hypothetical protein GEU90_21585 [Gemmatimonas sp.]|nr:hypothetical protein [Gemmatimonas sp.]
MNTPQLDKKGRSPARLLITLILPVALLIYSVFFFRAIYDLDLNSRAYPQFLIGILALLLFIQVGSDVREWLHSETHRSLLESWQRWRRTALAAAWTLIFIASIDTIGFYEALVPYVALLLPMIGARRPWTVALYTAGTALGIYLLFDLALRVRLPSGFLGL